jgi:hypothetical protein
MPEADFAPGHYAASRAIGQLWWLPLVRGKQPTSRTPSERSYDWTT